MFFVPGDSLCRGSSVVERRPEKAGVASSILAPGTILTVTLPSKFQFPGAI
jgi:hypothetical protein